MKKTIIKTDSDFDMDIQEDVHPDGEKFTSISFSSIKSGIGFLFLEENGKVSFSFNIHERNAKHIFKETQRNINDTTIVDESSIRTEKIKVGITSCSDQENKK